MIVFPSISPYIFEVNGIGPTWYGLMYVISFLIGYQWAKKVAKKLIDWNEEQVSDLLTYIIIGVVIGGRLGYVLFYGFDQLLKNPLFLFNITQGGMSFHGGLLGVIFAVWLFARKKYKSWLEVCDFIAPIIPIGLFFGRIGNFINSELWGKPTNLPWGVIFPNGGSLARHPSQLYEALLEGLALFIILLLVSKKVFRNGINMRPGLLSGIFLIGYGVARFMVEFVRVPDSHIGYWFDWVTRGQLLSIPMIIFGLGFVLFSYKKVASNKSN